LIATGLRAVAGLTLTEISRYDARGPAWYWNVLTLGEHTGTHFDAPIHWITGKDLAENATDRIAPRKFIGPACVIDVKADVQADHDFLLTPERVQSWETGAWTYPAGAWVLLRSGWSARTTREEFLNVPRGRAPLAGVLEGMLRIPGTRTQCPGRRRRGPLERTPGKPAPSIRHSPTTVRCMAQANSASPA